MNRSFAVLSYTGHALIDVGLAALAAHNGKTDPADLTPDDLENTGRYLAERYTVKSPLQGLVKGILVLNSKYDQRPELRDPYIQRVLFSWRPGTPTLPDTLCSFCGRPAAYRASREDVPLLNGRDVYNFGGRGQAGLPICGFCSLAMHMLPFGCLKISGRLLAIHSDDPAITFDCAHEALDYMQNMLSLPSNTDEGGLPGLSYERTRFVELVQRALRRSRRRGTAPSVTGYHFSNSGPDPDIRIFSLDSGVLDWLSEVEHHADITLTEAWQRVAASGWQDNPKAKKAQAARTDTENRRNTVYEDLLKLPQMSREFFDRYLRHSGHFGLTALFAERIMDMTPERIALLRTLGERFAEYAQRNRTFYFKFLRTDSYARWRRMLLEAADDAMRSNAVLISFDEFVEAFTAPEGEYNDWRLARDLVALRMMELNPLNLSVDDQPVFTDADEAADADETAQD
jgi:CRISPR-associated protein Cst1